MRPFLLLIAMATFSTSCNRVKCWNCTLNRKIYVIGDTSAPYQKVLSIDEKCTRNESDIDAWIKEGTRYSKDTNAFFEITVDSIWTLCEH